LTLIFFIIIITEVWLQQHDGHLHHHHRDAGSWTCHHQDAGRGRVTSLDVYIIIIPETLDASSSTCHAHTLAGGTAAASGCGGGGRR
jgi:hypothetical protein